MQSIATHPPGQPALLPALADPLRQIEVLARNPDGLTLTVVPLDMISNMGGTQPRAELEHWLIDEYAQCYRDLADMPPLDLFSDGKEYWLVDGFHRRMGALKAGLEKLRCYIRQGTLNDARWFSYGVNQTHGLRRSNADKEKAVRSALMHPNGAKKSDSQIAKYIGVAVHTVSKYRAELESTMQIAESPKRTGADGRTTDTTKIGKRVKVTAIGKLSKNTLPPGTTIIDIDPTPAEATAASAPAAVVVHPADRPPPCPHRGSTDRVDPTTNYETDVRKELAALGRKRQGLFEQIDRGDLSAADGVRALATFIHEAQDLKNRIAYRNLCDLLQFGNLVIDFEKSIGQADTRRFLRKAKISNRLIMQMRVFSKYSQAALDFYADGVNRKHGEISQEGYWRFVANGQRHNDDDVVEQPTAGDDGRPAE